MYWEKVQQSNDRVSEVLWECQVRIWLVWEELFHWNSGQLAQTGMILNNQVIAAALGLKNICAFLSWASTVCSFHYYTFNICSSFFPAKYNTLYN